MGKHGLTILLFSICLFFIGLFFASSSYANTCNEYALKQNVSPTYIQRGSDGTYYGYVILPWDKYLNPTTGKYRYLWSLYERISYDYGKHWTCPRKVASPPDIDSHIIEGYYDHNSTLDHRYFLAINRLVDISWSVKDTIEVPNTTYSDLSVIYQNTSWNSMWENAAIGFDSTNQNMVNLFKQLGYSTNRRRDNIYSPFTLPYKGSSRNFHLYFHGIAGVLPGGDDKWPDCGSYNFYDRTTIHNYCRCGVKKTNGYSSCTDDKIYYATNANTDNKLWWQVFSGEPRNYSDNTLKGQQWLSDTWREILSAYNAKIPGVCEAPFCDMLHHVGDPQVLHLPNGKYVMYFTASQLFLNPDNTYSHERPGVFVITSLDPIHFLSSADGIKPLRRKDGKTWYPADAVWDPKSIIPKDKLAYILSANNLFASVYEPKLNRIVMMVRTGELPSPYSGRNYRILIDPNDPYYAESVEEIDLTVESPYPNNILPTSFIEYGRTNDTNYPPRDGRVNSIDIVTIFKWLFTKITP